jgi:regulator of replication initiation timing
VGDTVLTEPFEVRADPASASDVADLDEQFRFLREVRDKLTEVHTQIRRIRAVRGQLVELKKRLGTEAEEIREAADALDEAITAVEEALYQTKNQSPQDPLNFPIRLNDKLAAVAGVAAIGDHAPTAQAWEVKRELEAKIDAELATLAGIWDDRLPALNAMVQGAAVPALTVEEE